MRIAICCFKAMTVPPLRCVLLFVVQIRIGKTELLHDVALKVWHHLFGFVPLYLLCYFIVLIRIGKAQFLHDVAFKLLHLFGFLILDMVIT